MRERERERKREREKYSPKSSLTLLAPTPTNISSNSDPAAKMNGTPASPRNSWSGLEITHLLSNLQLYSKYH